MRSELGYRISFELRVRLASSRSLQLTRAWRPPHRGAAHRRSQASQDTGSSTLSARCRECHKSVAIAPAREAAARRARRLCGARAPPRPVFARVSTSRSCSAFCGRFLRSSGICEHGSQRFRRTRTVRSRRAARRAVARRDGFVRTPRLAGDGRHVAAGSREPCSRGVPAPKWRPTPHVRPHRLPQAPEMSRRSAASARSTLASKLTVYPTKWKPGCCDQSS